MVRLGIKTADSGTFTTVGYITGTTLAPPNDDASSVYPSLPIESTIEFETKMPRPTWYLIMGIPYRHPRQVLHNGRKPRQEKKR